MKIPELKDTLTELMSLINKSNSRSNSAEERVHSIRDLKEAETLIKTEGKEQKRMQRRGESTRFIWNIMKTPNMRSSRKGGANRAESNLSRQCFRYTFHP